jgi:hypothetical protein
MIDVDKELRALRRKQQRKQHAFARAAAHSDARPAGYYPPHTGRARAPRADVVDHAAADELRLFAENTGELYNQKLAILHNLAKKMHAGKYDPSKAPKLWGYWVEAAAKRYVRENSPGAQWSRMFDAATRRHVAAELAKEYEARLRMEMQTGRPDW